MPGGRDLFDRPLSLTNPKKLSPTKEQKEILTQAWLVLVEEWAIRAQKRRYFLSPNITKGTLAVKFVRALLYREEIPRSATLAYTPSRFWTSGDGRFPPFSDVFEKALDNPSILASLRWSLNENTDWDKILGAPLPVHGHRMPNDFPVDLARDLINKYCPINGKVLDPCHGWGGRLLGFMLSHASYYLGIDPSPEVSRGVEDMFNDLSVYLTDKKTAEFINSPFEFTVSEVPSNYFDFVLTSPPYFNTEKYEGEKSSWRLYPTFDKWVEGFYQPLILRVAAALKSSAVFALQIASKRYPLRQIAEHVAREAQLKYIKTERSKSLAEGQYKLEEGDDEMQEVIVIFRKA